jgi:hypothetical protein
MKASEVVTALRELADRFEALGFDDDSKITADVRLSLFHIEDREDLVKLLPLVDRPRLNTEVPCIGPGPCCDGYEVTLFNEPGMVGGEAKVVYTDSQAGLDALMAPAEPA